MIHNSSLNYDSEKRIDNIVRNFRCHPNFRAYDIASFIYNSIRGIRALKISKNNQLINLWLFIPGIDGEIESMACYGMHLEGHYKAIRSSMKVFDMKVADINLEYSASPYIDIVLKAY